MPDVQAGRLIVRLEGQDVNLTTLLVRVEQQMKRSASSAKTYDTTLQQLSNSERRGEASKAAYAQALARSAVAAGDDAQAIKILSQTLQQLTPNTTAATNVLTQLQNTLNKQTTAAQQAAAAQEKANAAQLRATQQVGQNQLSAISSSIGALQRLATAYFAVTTVASAFTSVIAKGNELEKAEVTFRALSGSTEAYQQNLAAARDQQSRFGGSLTENIDGLSNFANLAKRTGININELAELARGLATIDRWSLVTVM